MRLFSYFFSSELDYYVKYSNNYFFIRVSNNDTHIYNLEVIKFSWCLGVLLWSFGSTPQFNIYMAINSHDNDFIKVRSGVLFSTWEDLTIFIKFDTRIHLWWAKAHLTICTTFTWNNFILFSLTLCHFMLKIKFYF